MINRQNIYLIFGLLLFSFSAISNPLETLDSVYQRSEQKIWEDLYKPEYILTNRFTLDQLKMRLDLLRNECKVIIPGVYECRALVGKDGVVNPNNCYFGIYHFQVDENGKIVAERQRHFSYFTHGQEGLFGHKSGCEVTKPNLFL